MEQTLPKLRLIWEVKYQVQEFVEILKKNHFRNMSLISLYHQLWSGTTKLTKTLSDYFSCMWKVAEDVTNVPHSRAILIFPITWIADGARKHFQISTFLLIFFRFQIDFSVVINENKLPMNQWTKLRFVHFKLTWLSWPFSSPPMLPRH